MCTCRFQMYTCTASPVRCGGQLQPHLYYKLQVCMLRGANVDLVCERT
eukprot:jgi/Botrbrau1/10841/Bobra.0025s0020.1